MSVLFVIRNKEKFNLRFVCSNFAIVVNKDTNEYSNVYTNECGIELLKTTLKPHPKFEKN